MLYTLCAYRFLLPSICGSFKAYNQEITDAKRRDEAPQAFWPCRLKIIAAPAKGDPVIPGVDVLDGSSQFGTSLAVVKMQIMLNPFIW